MLNENLKTPSTTSSQQPTLLSSTIRMAILSMVIASAPSKTSSQDTLPTKNNTPTPAVKPLNETEEEPHMVSAFEKAALKHPLARVVTLEKPKKESKELRIFALPSGVIKAETMLHLQDTGWISSMRKQRAEAEAAFTPDPFQRNITTPDIEPKNGSGFIFEYNKAWYIGSNVHVTNGTHREAEKLMTNNSDTDVSIVPGEIVQRCDGDKYELPIVSLEEKLTNKELCEHEVRITGLGSELFEITGKPFYFASHIEDKNDQEANEHILALRVKAEDIGGEQHAIIGMSGSRVELVDTRATVGILHSVQTLPDGSVLLRFTGPEELRESAKQASIDRMRWGNRLDMQTLVKVIDHAESQKVKPADQTDK